MRKFLLTALAVAMMAAPALAGDVTIGGKYMLQGYAWDVDGYTDGYYINDFEAILTLKSGDVTAVADLELVDSNYDGFGEVSGHTPVRGSDIVDNYYITAKLMDGLTLKTGEYALDWGNKIAIFNQGGYNIGITYSLDMLDLAFTIGKAVEADNWFTGEDADIDVYVLSAIFKKAGPFSKLNLHLAYVMGEEINDGYYGYNADFSDSLIGIEYAAAIGPVALSGEAGFFSGDYSEGNYFLLIAGLKELVGFDLNVLLFQASDDMSSWGENWSPLLVVGNDDAEWFDDTWGNTTFYGVNGSYAVNDKLSIGGAVVMITPTDGDWDVTEIDVTGTYKVADNFSVMAGAGMVSGDIPDITLYTAKAMFTF